MTARQIQMEVCATHGITHYMLIKGGEAKFVQARGEAMVRCHEELGMSYPQIGRLFQRHHTTVIHAIARYSRGPVPDRRYTATAPDSLERALVRQARIIASQGRTIADQSKQIEELAGEVEELCAAGMRTTEQRELFHQEKSA
jgi:hypothetical protein